MPTPVAERQSTTEQTVEPKSPDIPISVATRKNEPEPASKQTFEKSEESEPTMISTVGDDAIINFGTDLLTPIPQKDQPG